MSMGNLVIMWGFIFALLGAFFFVQNITFSRLVLKIIFEFFPFKSISQTNNSKFVILILKNTKITFFISCIYIISQKEMLLLQENKRVF